MIIVYINICFTGLAFDFWKPSQCEPFTGHFQNGMFFTFIISNADY